MPNKKPNKKLLTRLHKVEAATRRYAAEYKGLSEQDRAITEAVKIKTMDGYTLSPKNTYLVIRATQDIGAEIPSMVGPNSDAKAIGKVFPHDCPALGIYIPVVVEGKKTRFRFLMVHPVHCMVDKKPDPRRSNPAKHCKVTQHSA